MPAEAPVLSELSFVRGCEADEIGLSPHVTQSNEAGPHRSRNDSIALNVNDTEVLCLRSYRKIRLALIYSWWHGQHFEPLAL